MQADSRLIGNGMELYGVQMLRALAAIAVVIHHSLEESNKSPGRFSPDWLTTSGAAGVDLFFVISGFIMLYISFRPNHQPVTAGYFLLRRATRIYPLYWLCCVALLLASLVGVRRNFAWDMPSIIASVLLFPNDNMIIGVSWTLVYEIYFYLIFASTLIFRSFSVSILGTTATIFCLGLVGGLLPMGPVQSFLADPILWEFCAGVWLAWAFARRGDWPWSFPFSRIIGIVGFAFLIVAPLFVSHPDTRGLWGLPRVLAWGIPAVLVVAYFLTVGPPQNLIARFLVLLGDASYALYLTHVFVMFGYAWLLRGGFVGHLDQRPVVPVVIVATIIVALFTHLLVEKPLIGMLRNVTISQWPQTI